MSNRGQGSLEYVLILLLLVIVVIVILALVGPNVAAVLGTFLAQFTRAQIQTGLYVVVGSLVIALLAALIWQIWYMRR